MSSPQIAQRAQNQVDKLNAALSSQGHAGVNPNTFCILPFVHLSTSTTGGIHLCCRSFEIDKIQNNSLGDVWKGNLLAQVRDDLVNGVRRPECKSCWRLEDLGMVSLRMGQNLMRVERNHERVETWLESRSVASIQNLELKLSNLCNLKCRMCSPIASTPWMREWPKVREHYSAVDRAVIDESYQWQLEKKEPVLDFFMHNEKFLSEFESIADSIEELEFAGGEPLLDPLHYEVLKRVLHRSSEITLKYSTNLMVMGAGSFKILDFWPHFKEVKLTISLDGPPRLNEYIRTGSKSDVFEKNLAMVRSLPNVVLKVSTCVSAYNALFLKETAEYVSRLGIQWYSNRVVSPRFLDARILPRSLRNKAAQELRAVSVEVLREWGQSSRDAALSLRTVQDCASWLESDSLDSSAGVEFDKFIKYSEKLDESRKTDFSVFFKQNSEAESFFRSEAAPRY